MTHSKYELIVIGSGPAGEKGAAQAAYFGKRVALVEEKLALGGAAANTGTLPSKTLRETSLTLSGTRARQLDGVDLSLNRRATVRDLMHRETYVVKAERERIEANLHRHNIDYHRGLASLATGHRLSKRRPVTPSNLIITIRCHTCWRASCHRDLQCSALGQEGRSVWRTE